VALAALAALASTGIAAGARTVVGGQAVQVQSAPWTVYVQQTVGRTVFLCTGSVVDSSHVLTAAHCLFNDTGIQAPPSAL
jgi:secreted trypsin-like serine protease